MSAAREAGFEGVDQWWESRSRARQRSQRSVAEVGAGQWLRYVVGGLEVAGALGVLVPRLSGLAALGIAALMAGAAVTSVFVLGVSPVVPLALMVVAGLVAWFRRASVQALFPR